MFFKINPGVVYNPKTDTWFAVIVKPEEKEWLKSLTKEK